MKKQGSDAGLVLRNYIELCRGPLAQLARALHLQCRGQRFDPATVHQNRTREGFTEVLLDKTCRAKFQQIADKGSLKTG